MPYHVKLPPRTCADCGYTSTGGDFRKSFGRYWSGKERCPECKSRNIVAETSRAAPPPAPKPKIN